MLDELNIISTHIGSCFSPSKSAGGIQTLKMTLVFLCFVLFEGRVDSSSPYILHYIVIVLLDLLGPGYKVGTIIVVFVINFAIFMVHSLCDFGSIFLRFRTVSWYELVLWPLFTPLIV